ncbi:hypothetical protein FS837_011138 [Tulasnella sp. UAMH 9824]|nr:hypothetical protein FS837_011138 [Tulasnella sp. UAMH 9824]
MLNPRNTFLATVIHRNPVSADRAPLNDIIRATSLLSAEKRYLRTPSLALVLVHDLLLAKGGIQAKDGPIKQAVLRHRTRIQAEWVKLKIKRGVKGDVEMAQVDERQAQIPRYVRVNTNKWSLDEAVSHFRSQGYAQVQLISQNSEKEFHVDEHIQNLLVFPPKTTLLDDAAYEGGMVILQDKASCFSAAILAPPPNSIVIDATAAPGNKTTHLSALMGSTGRVIAFEKDKKRFATLEKMVSKAGCKNVETNCQDFLQTQPSDPTFSEVTHILLDPSCSGSGIVGRLDHLVENREDDGPEKEERLRKLSTFQRQTIEHAMQFPSVVKIVYSTCSIHPEENEHVVRDALAASSGRFELVSRSEALPAWSRRGLDSELRGVDAQSLIRCSPEDGTNGFFVACFRRVHNRGKRKDVNGLQNEVTSRTSIAENAYDKGKRKRRRKQVIESEQSKDEEEEWGGILS